MSYPEFLTYSLMAGCYTRLSEDSCVRSRREIVAYMGAGPQFRQMLGLDGRPPRSGRRRADDVLQALYRRDVANTEAQRRTAQATIVYDAVNAYNAPLRATEVCRFGEIGHKAKFAGDDMYDPSLDAEREAGWLAQRKAR